MNEEEARLKWECVDVHITVSCINDDLLVSAQGFSHIIVNEWLCNELHGSFKALSFLAAVRVGVLSSKRAKVVE